MIKKPMLLCVGFVLSGCVGRLPYNGYARKSVTDYVDSRREVIDIWCDGNWWTVFDRSTRK